MNSFENDVLRTKAVLTGRIDAYVYGRDGQLKRHAGGGNAICSRGLNRFAQMLVDTYRNDKPVAVQNYGQTSQLSTLNNYNEFGQKPGEIWGVSRLDWTGKSKSTFTRSGVQYGITGGNANGAYMFDNNPETYTNFNGVYENTYWVPGGSFDGGWVCDFGITDVSNESFSASLINTWANVGCKNLKYGTMIVKSNDLNTTYTNNTDYQWDTGDGDTYGKIKLLNAAIVGVPLKVSYSWFDVPQVPICGFSIDQSTHGDTRWEGQSWISWRWSLNQGQNRTNPFFPNVSGSPKRPGWQTYYWDRPWYPMIRYDWSGLKYTYFHNNLPWAVKNPTQMAWFGCNWYCNVRIYDFNLLGFHMPKMGAHAIGLGTGLGTPNSNDENLFSTPIKITTTRKARSGDSVLRIVANLDFNEGNLGTDFTEAGLYFPTDESKYFKVDDFWSNAQTVGGSGEHSDYIKGSNKILKLSSVSADDCDQLMTHAMFDTPWRKTSDERVGLVYTLNVDWN